MATARFLPLWGDDGEFDLPLFDVEDGVCRVALNKNAVVGTVFSTRCPGQKDSQIERRFGRLQAGLPPLLQDIAPLNGW